METDSQLFIDAVTVAPKGPTKNLKTPWGFDEEFCVLGRYKVSPFKRKLLINMTQDMSEIRQMEIREDDVMLVTYPKSGTNWTYEILKMLISRKAEYDKFAKGKEWLEVQTFDNLKELKSPRVLNTHLHVDDLPCGIVEKKCKTVIVLRNPKDVCVSLYNHNRSMDDFNGTLEDLLYLFTNDPSFCDWFEYTKAAYDFAKRHDFVYVLFFEDLKLNPVQEITKLAKFLDLDLCVDILSEIAEKCSFQNLKKASEKKQKPPKFNLFRKGVVGDWKNWFTVAQNEQFDSVYEERMTGCEIKFTFST